MLLLIAHFDTKDSVIAIAYGEINFDFNDIITTYSY